MAGVKPQYTLRQSGEEVQEILDRVEQKTIYGVATQQENGLMAKGDKVKLDSLDDDTALTIEDIDELCI